MNLLQLAQRLHRESARGGSGPTSISTASNIERRLFDWIADEWMTLQTRDLDWLFMRRRLSGAVLVPGTSNYTGLSLGVEGVGRWRPEGGDYAPSVYRPDTPTQPLYLEFANLDRFRRMYVDTPQAAGQPQHWSISETGAFLIGPAPDLAYFLTAEYTREPTELLEDAHEPDMPSRHHMLLVWRALAELGKLDNAPDVLARGIANYARAENSLLADQLPSIQFGGALA